MRSFIVMVQRRCDQLMDILLIGWSGMGYTRTVVAQGKSPFFLDDKVSRESEAIKKKCELYSVLDYVPVKLSRP